jgi:hypothetical protein
MFKESGSYSNIPDGTIRLNRTTKKFEEWNATTQAWGDPVADYSITVAGLKDLTATIAQINTACAGDTAKNSHTHSIKLATFDVPTALNWETQEISIPFRGIAAFYFCATSAYCIGFQNLVNLTTGLKKCIFRQPSGDFVERTALGYEQQEGVASQWIDITAITDTSLTLTRHRDGSPTSSYIYGHIVVLG